MDTTTIFKTVLPYLGAALGGPLGGGLATFAASKLGIPDSTVSAVTDAITGMLGNPEQVEKLKEVELASKEHLAQMGYDSLEKITIANLQAQVEVNKTMQAEAASDHWPTYSWRPAIGFAVAIDLTGAVVMVLGAYGAVMFGAAKPEILSYLPAALGALAALVGVAAPILGIASYFRGKAQADPNIQTDNRG